MRGGEGFYDQFYIRDGAYQILEYGEFGLSEAASKSLELYFPYQRPDGRFESQENQWDANGQAPWIFLQYYKMTRDRAWLNRAYPPMKKAAEWTIHVRREAPADSPFAGLLPPGVADGEFLWDGKHHIVGYDFCNFRGMLCTAEAAQSSARRRMPPRWRRRQRSTARRSTPPGDARDWPTFRPVGRRPARTGATSKRSGPVRSSIPRTRASPLQSITWQAVPRWIR